MYWVLQENSKNNGLIPVVKEKGLEHIVVNLSDIERQWIRRSEQPTVAFGSISLCCIAKSYEWKPGTFDNENFDQRIWTKEYAGHVLNDDAEFHAFGSLPAFQGTKFMRPINDLKVFAGMLVGGDEVESWKESLRKGESGFTSLRAHTVVSISSPKDIAMEWRFFVVDGKVVTGSQYQHWGFSSVREIEDQNELSWKFAQQMVDLWQPSQAFVLDVAMLEDSFKVIEINSINSSGLYASDARSIVEAIELCFG